MKTAAAPKTVPIPFLEEADKELDEITSRLRGAADLLKARFDPKVNACMCGIEVEGPLLFIVDTLTKLEELGSRVSEVLQAARKESGAQ